MVFENSTASRFCLKISRAIGRGAEIVKTAGERWRVSGATRARETLLAIAPTQRDILANILSR